MNGNNWKPKYVELVQKGQKEKAKELVLSQITDDRIIYKYFRGLNRDFKTIKKPELWLCNAYRLNDPFDCAFIKSFDNEAEKCQSREDSINKQNETFISCFSERSDSMVMWGTYANCHRGICVGYSLKEIVEKYDCLPVIYEKTLPRYTDDTSILINTLTKYIDWEYEHEWRIVNFNDGHRMSDGYLMDFVRPKEIILGYKNQDLLWKVDGADKKTSKDEDDSLEEVGANQLIRYSEDVLGTQCFQYTMSDNGFMLEKIIRF